MDFLEFNELRRYENIIDFYRNHEYDTSNVLCMLLNGKMKGEDKK